MLTKTALGVFLTLCWLQAFANTLHSDNADIKKLDEIIVSTHLNPVGEATFSFLFWDVYKSRLKTSSGNFSHQSEEEFILYEINYLMDISADDLVQRTVEQWQHLGLQPEVFTPYLPELQNMWPNIQKGDTLSLLVTENKSRFYLNNTFIGRIDKPEFGQVFLDIWLSEKTSQPSLRKQLLGISTDD